MKRKSIILLITACISVSAFQAVNVKAEEQGQQNVQNVINKENPQNDMVHFEDKNLSYAVHKSLGIDFDKDVPKEQLKNITELSAGFGSIQSLDGLQYCTNLKILYLNDCGLKNIDIVAQLPNLTYLSATGNFLIEVPRFGEESKIESLNLSGNSIKDVTDFNKLKNLKTLELSKNRIESLDGLKGNKTINRLNISENEIKDFKPLTTFDNLEYLDASKCNLYDVNDIAKISKLKGLSVDSNHIMDFSPLGMLKNFDRNQLHAEQNSRTLDSELVKDNMVIIENPAKDIDGKPIAPVFIDKAGIYDSENKTIIWKDVPHTEENEFYCAKDNYYLSFKLPLKYADKALENNNTVGEAEPKAQETNKVNDASEKLDKVQENRNSSNADVNTVKTSDASLGSLFATSILSLGGALAAIRKRK